MKLRQIYETCVATGMANDARTREEIERVLARRRRSSTSSTRRDRTFFDAEKLTNPYSDTRIEVGDPDQEVRGLLVGIDMEVGEVLLADRLREKGAPIDLVFAHHPEGPGYANLHEVMYMQADLWAAQGVSIAAGDALIAPRARGDPAPDHAEQLLAHDPGGRAPRLRDDVVPHAGGQLGQRVRAALPRRA